VIATPGFTWGGCPDAGGAPLIGILPDVRILDPGVPDPKSESSDRLTYQVTFWQRFAEPGQVPPEHGPFLSDVWQMTDTDVKEVIAWADTKAEPWQTYQVHVAVVDANPAVGLLCLYGTNPVPGYGPA
jgi:hypothetical protein